MRRRFLLIVFLFFCIGMLRIFIAPDGEPGSSMAAYREGTKALLLLLQAKGADPRQYLHPVHELRQTPELAHDTTMFIAAPSTIGTEDELLEWVGDGNRAVLFDSPQRVFKALLKSVDAEYSGDASATLDWAISTDPVSTVHDTPLAPLREVQKLTVPGMVRVKAPHGATVFLGTPDLAEGFMLPVGKGELWYFTGVEPISNRSIDRYDNLRFFYQLATSGKQLLFDEFHHGFTVPLGAAKQEAWDTVLLLAGSLAAWLAAGVLSRARRFGAPIAEEHEGVSASSDLARVIGALYAEHHAASVMRHYVRSWRHRAALRFGIAEQWGAKEFAGELEERGSIAPEERETLIRHLLLLEQAEDHTDGAYEQSVLALERLLCRGEQRDPVPT